MRRFTTPKPDKSHPRLMILGSADLPSNMWSKPRPIGPYLALEASQARFSETQRRAKRVFDLIVAVPLLILASPFIGAAAIAVKIVSLGPAFFSQVREGIQGRPVRIYKIRSMVPRCGKTPWCLSCSQPRGAIRVGKNNEVATRSTYPADNRPVHPPD